MYEEMKRRTDTSSTDLPMRCAVLVGGTDSKTLGATSVDGSKAELSFYGCAGLA